MRLKSLLTIEESKVHDSFSGDHLKTVRNRGYGTYAKRPENQN
jgi:hypothetical protein